VKRFTALILCLMLFLIPAARAENAELSTLEKLLERWFQYIGTQDQMLSGEIMLSDHTLTFTQQPTWENLLRARAAAGIVREVRSDLAGRILLPELTDAEYAELALRGIMVDVAREETPELNKYASTEILELLNWSTTLHGNCFDIRSIEWLTELAELKKQSALYECRWYVITTNALLASLNNDEAARDIWEQLPALYPCIFATDPEYIPLLADTVPVAEETITILESQLTAYQAHLGAAENDLNNMYYVAFVNEPYFTKENMLLIEDAPLLLPLAPWHGKLGGEIFVHYTVNKEGKLIRLNAESDLNTELPMVECIYTSDVDKALAVSYADLLAEIGLSFTQSGNDSDDQAWSRTFDAIAGDLMIRWENGNVSIWNIGMKVMFIPDWYAALLSLE